MLISDYKIALSNIMLTVEENNVGWVARTLQIVKNQYIAYWRPPHRRGLFLCTHGSTLEDLINCGTCSTVVCAIEKNLSVSGPARFKPVLSQGRLQSLCLVSSHIKWVKTLPARALTNPLYRWGNGGTSQLSNLPKVQKLVISGTKILTSNLSLDPCWDACLPLPDPHPTQASITASPVFSFPTILSQRRVPFPVTYPLDNSGVHPHTCLFIPILTSWVMSHVAS